MKEKKGKKSLRDVENLVVKRSTRLKQLSKTVSNSLGTSTVSISTTSSSDLPPSLYIVNDSIKICTIVGIYINRRKRILNTPYKIYDASNLIYIGGGNNVVGGWFYYKNPNGGNTNFSDTIFGNVNGYLFLFFGKTNIMKYKRGGVCTQCYKKTDPDVYDECEVFNSNQGPIFAVVISSISHINALNRTYASQSNGFYLSNTINDTLKGNNQQTIKSVIEDLKRSDGGGATQILLADPVNPNPLILNDFINLSCKTNAVFYINDEIIPRYYPFKVNQNTFLPESEAKKLTFDDIKLIGGWNGFLTVEAELNYNNGNPIIQFKQTGSSTITFRNRYFEDTENISGNPKGPRFYGPKYFTLRINVTLSFYFKQEEFRMQRDSTLTTIDLSSYATTGEYLSIDDPDIIRGKIETGYYPFNYKIENIPGVSSIILMQDFNGFIVNIPPNVPVGCKLTISRVGFENQRTSANFIWI
jgi:hypothetical protein